jgi:hypothetical protein
VGNRLGNPRIVMMDSARPFHRRSGRHTPSDDIAVSGDVVSDGALPPAVPDRLDAWMTRVVVMKTDRESSAPAFPSS